MTPLDFTRAACNCSAATCGMSRKIRRCAAPALVLPAQGAVARRRFPGFVAVGQDNHATHVFDKSREHRPDVESAAEAGCPVARIAARQVSMPSPTNSTSPGSASRAALRGRISSSADRWAGAGEISDRQGFARLRPDHLENVARQRLGVYGVPSSVLRYAALGSAAPARAAFLFRGA